MIISVRKEIPIGHRLRNHKGLCKNLHGHNYVFEVEIVGPVQLESGMVLDYSDVKKALQPLWDKLDHAMVLEEGDDFLGMFYPSYPSMTKVVVFSEPPTAENFTRFVRGWIRSRGFECYNVRVRETSDTYAQCDASDDDDVIEVHV